MPWNLALAALIGLLLLLSRLTIGASVDLANAHHLIGFLALTVVSVAAEEVARPLRYLNVPLGLALIFVPFLYDGDVLAIVFSLAAGLLLAGLSLRPGPIRERHGDWNRLIV